METNLEKLDFRSITRDPDKAHSTVIIYKDFTPIPWIESGTASLQHFDNTDRWILKAYLNDGITDFEHDSAYAFWLPLIGLTFKSLLYQTSFFTAWIDPSSPDDFKVPPPDYDPAKLPGTFKCEEPYCRQEDGPHIIVPEGYFTPPFDPQLYRRVAGKRVEIRIGPRWKENG